jgi:non-heme chloroperoxidase
VQAFDEVRAGVLADRSQFSRDLSAPFSGTDRPASTISEGQREEFWRLGMQSGLAETYDCITARSETGFAEDLQALGVPVFIAHGSDDQIAPIAAAVERSISPVEDGNPKAYPDAPHGIAGRYQQALDADLLAFWKS